MSSTPASLRLVDVDPEALAIDVVKLTRRHVERFADPLAPGFQIDMVPRHPGTEPDARSTEIGRSMMRLTRYAQTGDAGDWTPHERQDAIRRCAACLYDPAIRTHAFDVATLEQIADASTTHGIVLLGAWGRDMLERRQPVSARVVAVLGGVDPKHIRRIVTLEIASPHRPTTYTAASVLRWLRERSA